MKNRLIAGGICFVLAALVFVLDLDYFAFTWRTGRVEIYTAAGLALLGLVFIVNAIRRESQEPLNQKPTGS
jgi:hypothetical protein